MLVLSALTAVSIESPKQYEITLGGEFTGGESSWWRGDRKPASAMHQSHSGLSSGLHFAKCLSLEQSRNCDITSNFVLHSAVQTYNCD